MVRLDWRKNTSTQVYKHLHPPLSGEVSPTFPKFRHHASKSVTANLVGDTHMVKIRLFKIWTPPNDRQFGGEIHPSDCHFGHPQFEKGSGSLAEERPKLGWYTHHSDQYPNTAPCWQWIHTPWRIMSTYSFYPHVYLRPTNIVIFHGHHSRKQ